MFIHPKNLGLCKSINYNKGIYQLPHSSGTCMDLHHFVPSVCNSSCQKWYIWVHQYIHLKSWEMLVELDQCFSIFLKGVPEMIWVFKGSISKKNILHYIITYKNLIYRIPIILPSGNSTWRTGKSPYFSECQIIHGLSSNCVLWLPQAIIHFNPFYRWIFPWKSPPSIYGISPWLWKPPQKS